MTIRILLPLVLGALCICTVKAAQVMQADSIKTSTASTKNDLKKTPPDSAHNAQVAVKRSALVPGYGQLYNGQWWKLPVIYAGMGALLGSAISNYRYYKKHLVVYKYYRSMTTVTRDMPEYKLFTNYRNTCITLNQLKSAVNGAQRDTQFYYLCFAGAWGLRIVDAYIDAKFIHSYSMSPDLSLKIKPKWHLQTTGPAYFSAAMFTPMLCMSVNF